MSVCHVCGKKFTQKKNMYQHIRTIHKVDVDFQGSIVCPVCSSPFQIYDKLRFHLTDVHNINICRKNLSFNNLSDFNLWKDTLEKTSNAAYRSLRSVVTGSGLKKTYYACHRSGMYDSKSAGTRQIKAQGSCKIEAHCPSAIECIVGDDIQVTFYETHIGHEVEMKHLPLNKLDKEILSRKISDGVSLSKCLDDVRNSLDDKLERVHLLTRKDLRNIGHTKSLFNPERLHSNDPTSVHLFVQKMSELGDESPVVFFKPQGEKLHNLASDDFLIVLMSPAQREILLKFGHDKICIDSTHGTNAYNFHLTTLVVVDEFASGFPVSYCISNKIDSEQMDIFFQKVCEKTLPIATKVFMSDDAPVYYKSWAKIMGPAEKRLLCMWHVDRNWRKNLNKIRSYNKRSVVYKQLRTVLEEMDPNVFSVLLSNLISDLRNDEDTKSFANYFKTYYGEGPELWAYCYRRNAGISTNMYLKSLHKTLKHVYMQGKISKRVDRCLALLMKIVKDKIFARFTYLIKGGVCKKASEIYKRHKEGMHLKQNVNDLSNMWQISSQRCSSVMYDVTKINENCINCELKCTVCNISIHSYFCTCVDNGMKLNICKHIHAVHATISGPSVSIMKPEISVISEITSSDCYKECRASTSREDDNSDIKAKLSYALSLIDNKNLKLEDKTLVNRYLDKIIDIVRVDDVYKEEASEPQNKRIKLQPRFFSTKKENAKSKSLSKPSLLYKLEVTNAALNGNDAINVHSDFDHTYSKL